MEVRWTSNQGVELDLSSFFLSTPWWYICGELKGNIGSGHGADFPTPSVFFLFLPSYLDLTLYPHFIPFNLLLFPTFYLPQYLIE